jgi:hypothetical protein
MAAIHGLFVLPRCLTVSKDSSSKQFYNASIIDSKQKARY